MSIVNQYDASFNEDMSTERWYQDFCKSLSGRSNIFNLNYDNTIENSLSEYEDGFPPIKDGEDYSRFSARRYYENSRGVSTIAHLHGQILFSEAREYPFDYSMRDMVKNRDYKTACKNRVVGSFPHLIIFRNTIELAAITILCHSHCYPSRGGVPYLAACFRQL